MSLLIIFVLLVFVFIGFLYFNSRDNLSSVNKKIIGEEDITKKSYGYPLIHLLSYNDNELSIDAGIYRFGDIDQDGIVGENDIEALKIMIDTDKIGFTDGQIKLADVNEDGVISDDDVKMFEQYLKNNKEVKYSVNSEMLSYCISAVNDNTTCSWQKSYKFNIEKGKDYYVFVKQNNNGRISDVMLFEKETTEIKDI